MTTDCGLKYILECIRASKNNEHWAYLSEETRSELEKRGFSIKQRDRHTMAKITWPRF